MNEHVTFGGYSQYIPGVNCANSEIQILRFKAKLPTCYLFRPRQTILPL